MGSSPPERPSSAGDNTDICEEKQEVSKSVVATPMWSFSVIFVSLTWLSLVVTGWQSTRRTPPQSKRSAPVRTCRAVSSAASPNQSISAGFVCCSTRGWNTLSGEWTEFHLFFFYSWEATGQEAGGHSRARLQNSISGDEDSQSFDEDDKKKREIGWEMDFWTHCPVVWHLKLVM